MTTMNPLPPDPYKALGVEKDSDISAIKTAYRKLVLKCHPDKVQDPALKASKQDEFQRVQQAYEILSDDKKRSEYDQDVKLKKLREEMQRSMPRHQARPSPKAYYTEFNVRTAEPPPGFRAGPPPGGVPRSPYPGNPQFSSSWDRDIPSHSKPIYDEERRARRSQSYEKPRKDEESKEEKRRRREAEDKEKRRIDREREKLKEREREERKARQREHERIERIEREKAEARAAEEREARKAEERRAKKEREKERERMTKEIDQQRRRQQDEKHASRKPIYVEPYEVDEEHHSGNSKKKAAPGSTKKHQDSPRREKSSRREGSPSDDSNAKFQNNMQAAADYMKMARRKDSNSGPTGFDAEAAFSGQFPNPEDTWRAPPETPRSRRPSYQEERKFQASVEEDDPDVVTVEPSAPPPPRLKKAFTSPPGQMGQLHNMANSSAPRTPHLPRAQTMHGEWGATTPPAAPPAPSGEGRHSHRSDRRPRRPSEDYDDDQPRRSRAPPKIVRYPEEDVHKSRYQTTEDYYGGRGPFGKIKMAPTYSPEQVLYETKRYATADVSYGDVSRSYGQGGYYASAPYQVHG
jgi:curved DNA-binding protein CbpA